MGGLGTGEVMKSVKKTVRDEDLAKVGSALRWAAKQAGRIAERTHTPLVVYQQGRVMRERIKKEETRQAKDGHVPESRGKP